MFSDAAAREEEQEDVEAVREVVRGIDWCEVTLIEREENYGLARSILEGYDYVLERHDSLIMVEDDCVPSPDFVEFMTRCLDEYENTEKVMNVHGYCPPIDIPDEYPYDVFFTYRLGSWGQGVWKDSWDKLELSPEAFYEVQDSSDGRERLKRAGTDLERMLRDAIDGDVDSIGAWWSLTLIRHGGLSVNPTKTYVKEIGHDVTGTHSGRTSRFEVELKPKRPTPELAFPDEPFVDEMLNHRFNKSITWGSRWDRIVQWIKDQFLV